MAKRKDFETHNRYPEYAPMHAYNKRGKTSHKKKTLLAAALKYAVAAGAIFLGLAISLSLYIVSTLTSVGANQASVHARVFSIRASERAKTITYQLVREADSQALASGDFVADAQLSFEQLKPQTFYVVAYYADTEDGVQEQVGRFRFRTCGNAVGVGEDLHDGAQGGQVQGDGDGGGEGGDNPIIITPENPPAELRISTRTIPNGTEEAAYSAAIGVYYTGSAQLRFTASGLPNGLSITSDGKLTGTPATGTAAGSPYAVRVAATDGDVRAEADYELVILPAATEPLAITNESLGSTRRGYRVSKQITIDRASTEGVTFGAEGLPSGLTVKSSTGAITGVVSASADVGTYMVTLTAQDGAIKATKTLSFYVGDEKQDAVDLSVYQFVGEAIGTHSLAPSAKVIVNGAENVSATVTYPGGTLPGTVVSSSGGRIDYVFSNVTANANAQTVLTLNVSYTLNGESRTRHATITVSHGVFTGMPATTSAQVQGGRVIAQVTPITFTGIEPYIDTVTINAENAAFSFDGGTLSASIAATGETLGTPISLTFGWFETKMQFSHPGSMSGAMYDDFVTAGCTGTVTSVAP